jgi:hypothetical protein
VAGRIVVQSCDHVTALMMSAIASVVTLVPLMEVNRAAEPAPGLEEHSAIKAVCSEVLCTDDRSRLRFAPRPDAAPGLGEEVLRAGAITGRSAGHARWRTSTRGR